MPSNTSSEWSPSSTRNATRMGLGRAVPVRSTIGSVSCWLRLSNTSPGRCGKIINESHRSRTQPLNPDVWTQQTLEQSDGNVLAGFEKCKIWSSLGQKWSNSPRGALSRVVLKKNAPARTEGVRFTRAAPLSFGDLRRAGRTMAFGPRRREFVLDLRRRRGPELKAPARSRASRLLLLL